MTLFRRKKKEEKKPEKTSGEAAVAKRSKPTKPVKAKKRSAAAEQVAYRVIIRPHITEKAGRLSGMNQYVFRVAKSAGKQEIAQAIQELYGITPVRVNTVSIPGKRRRLGKTEGRIAGYKKAYVTLPEGKTIELNV